MSLQQDFPVAITALREKHPLVHCITNYVTAGDTANMLLAAGASPIMADDPAEAAEITSRADALLLNMGTLSERHISSMLKAGEAANRRGIPVVLDPVGVHLSDFRGEAVMKILSEVKISVIRGNLSEMLNMGGVSVKSHGIDSDDDEHNRDLDLSASADTAQRYCCVCAVTGTEDIITDGQRAVQLLNGTSSLKKITGAGDMTSALIAAFSAVCDPFSAAVFGTAFMGICGELSDYIPSGRYMGSFRSNLFDIAGKDGANFAEHIKIEE